jgi:hypothetical protein
LSRNVLALDLATKTGWAVFLQGVRESGTETFDVKRGAWPGSRYVRLWNFLKEKCLVWHKDGQYTVVNLIVFEQNLGRFAKGQAQADISSKMIGTVEAFCARYRIPHIPVWPGTLKKWTSGDGRAKKPKMISFVIGRFFPHLDLEGHAELTKTLDDNEADAIALLEYALAEIPEEAIA